MDDSHTPLDTPCSHNDSMPHHFDGTASRNAREAHDASLEARLDAACAWEVSDYFGGCPLCRRIEAQLNVYKANYMVCHTHKTVWCVGVNLLGTWRWESEDIWERNEALLASYTEVEPLDNPIFRGHGDACTRCGARDVVQEKHHPLCQHADGTPTALQDSVVRILLEVGASRELMKALIRRALHSGAIAVTPQMRWVSVPKATSEGRSA